MMFKRQKLYVCTLLIVLISSLLSVDAIGIASKSGVNGDYLEIVSNSKPNAVVIIHTDRDENIDAAASLLIEYIEKATGARLQLVEGGENTNILEDQVRIYVGHSYKAGDSFIESQLDNMGDEAFLIYSKDNNIIITGSTTWGVKYGVYEFLERYVDVRWLMPGADGEDVPETENLIIPREIIKEEPAFMMRVMSPLNAPGNVLGEIQYDWAMNNRLNPHFTPIQRVHFHHNIWQLFPQEKYGQTNPEFYPTQNGKRYIPAKGVKVGWQPCFAEPSTVDVAVESIIKYFDENPEATSFSLGVNDSRGYCDGTHSDNPHEHNKINSVGLPCHSDVYYKWVNDVVAKVREEYPDKWFGLLAYDNVMDPPSFKLDDHVVPFITKDRLTWIDPEVERIGKQQMESWKGVSDNIGWYDYLYGAWYMIPRVYPHAMAENYKYAKENGVSVHYAELYPNWGEGPKAWLSAKLQWNPYQNVDELLDEWYERAVGKAAAPYLKQYYEHWEEFWTERIKESLWFDLGKNTSYLYFNRADYLSLVTDNDMIRSRELLETVLDKAVTDKQKARAQIIYRMFEYYEASALSYPKEYRDDLDQETALSLLADDLMGRQMELASRRNNLIDDFMKDPILKFWKDPRDTGLQWDGLNGSQYWALVDYLNQYEPNGGVVTDRVKQLAFGDKESKTREFARLLAQRNNEKGILNKNSSFEDGEQDWTKWFKTAGIGEMEVSKEQSYTGNVSLKIIDLDRGGPVQIVPVKPGLASFRAYYYTEKDSKTNGTITLGANFLDENRKSLRSLPAEERLISSTAGKWEPIERLIDIPETINGKKVEYVQIIVVVNGLRDGVVLYIDDVEFRQATESVESGEYVVIDIIKALPSVDEITLEDKEIVENARTAYEALSEDEKSLVTNIDKLIAAEAKIIELEDRAMADEVIAQINELPDEITLENEEKIKAIRIAYEELTEAQKALVSEETLNKLIMAEKKIAELNDSGDQKDPEEKTVIAAIDSLPSIDKMKLKHKAAVQSVRAAYEALPNDKKVLITNIDKLIAAEAKIIELEDRAMADEVIAQINELPDEITLENEEKIKAIRIAYEELTEAQKALVSEETLNKLILAEKKIKEELGGKVKPLLPKTGTVNIEMFYAIGILLILLGITLKTRLQKQNRSK